MIETLFLNAILGKLKIGKFVIPHGWIFTGAGSEKTLRNSTLTRFREQLNIWTGIMFIRLATLGASLKRNCMIRD